MKCIVCDKCKKVIEDVRRCRVITCAKPFRPDVMDKPNYRGNEPRDNDIQWTKELCPDCVEALTEFIDQPEDGDGNENAVPPQE